MSLQPDELLTKHLFQALLCTLCIACAPLIETTDGQRLRATSDEFKDYAAAIFRQHNATSVNIIETLDVITQHPQLGLDDHIPQLQAADDQMLNACAPLNRFAANRRDGSNSSRSEQFALVNAVPECQRSTLNAEKLVSNLYDQIEQ